MVAVQMPPTFRKLLDDLAAEHMALLGENAALQSELSRLEAAQSEAVFSGLLRDSFTEAQSASPVQSAPLGGYPSWNKDGTGQDMFGLTPVVPAPPQEKRPSVPRTSAPPLPGVPQRLSEHDAPGAVSPTQRPPKGPQECWGFVRSRVRAGEVTQQAMAGREAAKEPKLSVRSESMGLNLVWKQEAAVRPESDCAPTPSTTTSTARLQRSGQKVWESGAQGFLQRFILKPDDKKHLAWDICSLFMLAYDVLSTPLDVFDLPETGFTRTMAMTTLIFWTIDILISFLSGYHTVAEIETRPWKIACHYLRTWFIVDFTTVALEWLSVGGTVFLRLGKFARGARVIRMLRIVKVRVLFQEVDDFIRSETIMMVFKIARLVVFIVAINHFVACGWWAVGRLVPGMDHTWPGNDDRFNDENIGSNRAYAYFTSLHWALTQFTPASMEVAPTNTAERAFTISVMVLGLLVFSSFLSSISSLMTQLRQMQSAKHQEDLLIRRYLMEHDVSLALGNRILFFFRQNRRFVKKKRLVEQDVKALEALPDNLKTELHWEVYAPIVILHPLFSTLNDEHHTALVEVCHRSMTEKLLGQGIEVFHYGKAAECMYFAVKGGLLYVPGQVCINNHGVQVQPEQWISEMVLWMKWVHQGTVCADQNHTEIMQFNSKKFHEHVKNHPSCFAMCRTYAKLYVQLVSDYLDSQKTLPEDTWGGADGREEDLLRIVRETRDRLRRNRRNESGNMSLWGIFFDTTEGRNMTRTFTRLATKLQLQDN